MSEIRNHCFECKYLILERKNDIPTGAHYCEKWKGYRALWQDANICSFFKNKSELAIVDRDAGTHLDISDMLPEELRRSWSHRSGAKYAIEYIIKAGYVLEVK